MLTCASFGFTKFEVEWDLYSDPIGDLLERMLYEVGSTVTFYFDPLFAEHDLDWTLFGCEVWGSEAKTD